MINFPTTESPNNRYKYLSLELNLNLDRGSWNRQTYSFLDWLGDLGGLLDALFYLAQGLLIPFQSFTFNSKLLTTLIRFRPSGEGDDSESPELILNSEHHLTKTLKKD